MLTSVVTHSCPTTAGTGLGPLTAEVLSTGAARLGESVLSRLVLSSALETAAIRSPFAASRRPSPGEATAWVAGPEPEFGQRVATRVTTRATPSSAAPMPAATTGRGRRG